MGVLRYTYKHMYIRREDKRFCGGHVEMKGKKENKLQDMNYTSLVPTGVILDEESRIQVSAMTRVAIFLGKKLYTYTHVCEEYDAKKDSRAVEEMENKCEVGPSNKLSLYTDLLGDPICRVRNSPAYFMLVAEMVVVGGREDKERREIVGMIRGCVKTVTCGTKLSRNGKNGSIKTTEPVPIFTKLAYILGLRVSPSHRRMGIGLKLVRKMEEWFSDNGAEYSYMATENDNQASVKLFTQKCGYSKFRTPSILVQPVFAHRVRVDNRVTIIKLGTADAESLYRRRFSTTEFFPRDIDAVLNNKLNLGTFLAVPKGSYDAVSWPGADEFLAGQPESWAVLSVWNCKDVYRLEVRGASREESPGQDHARSGPGFTLATVAFGARSVQAVWVSFSLWAWW
ncbi:hypothetical protein DH2020_040929 [Rehmannia glutinosa]|uniref:N-acetyltransferase domain-containing protein n=1 Tax=Rehmannia glutinosa TaxID=99300 RepID=A0ABR0USS9_REHGL